MLAPKPALGHWREYRFAYYGVLYCAAMVIFLWLDSTRVERRFADEESWPLRQGVVVSAEVTQSLHHGASVGHITTLIDLEIQESPPSGVVHTFYARTFGRQHPEYDEILPVGAEVEFRMNIESLAMVLVKPVKLRSQ